MILSAHHQSIMQRQRQRRSPVYMQNLHILLCLVLPRPHICHFFLHTRLEIRRDHRDRRSCKIVSSCVIFSRKQYVNLKICVEIWNLLIYLVSLRTHFLQNYWKFTFSFQFQQKKDQNDLYWNLRCFIFSKNGRDFRVFGV